MLVAALAPPPSGRLRRRDALSELRRSEILAAATKVFGRKGFEATRADDIAQAASIAKGTLYLYFKSKEAIYAAAVTQAVHELEARLAQESASASGYREQLETAIRVRLEFWPSQKAIYRLLMTVGRSTQHRRQTHQVLRGAQASFVAVFEHGVAAGEVESQDFAPLAWATLDMIRGANERRMDGLSTTTPQDDAEWIMSCVLGQLHPG